MLAGLNHPEEAVRQWGMFVGLDRHRAGKQRDAVARLGEVILHGDPAFHASVAVPIVAQAPDRVEDPHLGAHGNGEVPREDPLCVRA